MLDCYFLSHLKHLPWGWWWGQGTKDSHDILPRQGREARGECPWQTCPHSSRLHYKHIWTHLFMQHFVAMHKAFKGPNQGCIIYCLIDFYCRIVSWIVAIANNNILGTLIARSAYICPVNPLNYPEGSETKHSNVNLWRENHEHFTSTWWRNKFVPYNYYTQQEASIFVVSPHHFETISTTFSNPAPFLWGLPQCWPCQEGW